MHCSKCGAKFQDDELFCTKCGFLEDIAVIAKIKEKSTKEETVKLQIFGGFWRRCGALVLDLIILTVSELIIIATMGFAIFGMAVFGNIVTGKGTVDHQVIQSFVQGFGAVLLVGLYWAYFTGLESSKRQATFGKMLMNLYVADKAGDRLSFGQANLRYWSKIISLLILGIGFLMVFFNKKKRALHDIFAGTQVLLKKIKTPKSKAKPEEKTEIVAPVGVE